MRVLQLFAHQAPKSVFGNAVAQAAAQRRRGGKLPRAENQAVGGVLQTPRDFDYVGGQMLPVGVGGHYAAGLRQRAAEVVQSGLHRRSLAEIDRVPQQRDAGQRGQGIEQRPARRVAAVIDDENRRQFPNTAKLAHEGRQALVGVVGGDQDGHVHQRLSFLP